MHPWERQHQPGSALHWLVLGHPDKPWAHSQLLHQQHHAAARVTPVTAWHHYSVLLKSHEPRTSQTTQLKIKTKIQREFVSNVSCPSCSSRCNHPAGRSGSPCTQPWGTSDPLHPTPSVRVPPKHPCVSRDPSTTGTRTLLLPISQQQNLTLGSASPTSTGLQMPETPLAAAAPLTPTPDGVTPTPGTMLEPSEGPRVLGRSPTRPQNPVRPGFPSSPGISPG